MFSSVHEKIQLRPWWNEQCVIFALEIFKRGLFFLIKCIYTDKFNKVLQNKKRP